MPIISVEIMKTTDEREMQKTIQEKKKKKKQKGAKGTEAIAKGRELSGFVVHLSTSVFSS